MRDEGGPAFPQVETRYEGEQGDYTQFVESTGGMTLRDYFAAKAMQAAITTSGAPYMTKDPGCAKTVAAMAYQVADAMLAERLKAAQ